MENLLKNIKKQMSYRVFVENHPAIILIIDSESGEIMDANSSAQDFYGYSKEEFLGKNINEINTYSKEDVYLEMQMAKKQKRNFFKFIHKKKDGSLKNVNVVSYPIIYNDKEYLFSVIMEYSDNSKVDLDILELINTSDDAICLVSSANIAVGEVVYANRAFAEVMDMDLQSIKHLSITDLFLNLDDESAIAKNYNGGTYTLTLNNDEKLSVQVNCLKIKNKGEVFSLLHTKPISYKLISAIDIKEEFVDEIKRKFKDNEGYIIGVELYSNSLEMDYINKYHDYLKKHMVSSMRLNMIKFHIGKEGLKILLFTNSSLFDITRTLNEFLSRVEEDEKHQFYSKFCKFRVGVSRNDKKWDTQISSLYKSLNSFSNYQYNSVIYATRNDDFFRSVKLKKDLPKAIENAEFLLHAQAIVNIDTKLVDGVEVLIRWQHKDYGLVYPNDFIKYAEISGAIKEIDLWVLAESLNFIEENIEKVGDLKFHINLSSRSFELQELYLLLSSYNIEILKNVVLEITEQSNYEILNETYDIVKSTGVEFAIDDFGTGYSSFERIRKSGVKYIKIDRSLIKNIVNNTDDLIILQTILAMCESLQIEVIAEGVEEIDQLEFLDARRCNLIQGFLFDRPLELDKLFERIALIEEKAIKHIAPDIDSSSLAKTFYNSGRIFVQNLDKNFKLKNPNIQLAEKLGIEMDEFLDIEFPELLKENERMYFYNAVERGLKNDDIISVTTQFHSKGQVFDVICAGEKNKDGTVRMYIEFLENQKFDENILKGLSKSYMESFYKAPVGMVIISQDFKIKKWNEACTDIFGYSVAEVIGENLSKLITKKGMPEVLNKVFNNALIGGSHEAVVDNIDKNSKPIICKWIVNCIDESSSSDKMYICIIENITESLEMEREMLKINNALNQTKSAIIMTDLEGKLTYVNDTFSEITGYTKEESLGENTSILSSKEQDADFYDELWSTINAGEIWRGEFRNKKKDDSLYWAKASIYPIIEDGEIQGFIGIQSDVTSEKELLDSNEELKLKLYEQDKIASLGLLTSGLMHEINNPLSYIQGNIEFLSSELEKITDKELESHKVFVETLDDIQLGIKQIKDIAVGLKKYVFKDKVETAKEVNLVETIGEVLTISRNEYKYYANIHFDYDKGQKYIVMGFDPKLKQVIMNLVINASHAIAAKKMQSFGLISISLTDKDDYIVIKFSDNGLGMSDEIKENIFEAFFTTKESGVGSGLGLSITKDIIENNHKGSIVCESILGQGTSFTIELPKRIKE